MHKIYVILFFLVEIGHHVMCVNSHYVNCFSEKVTDYTGRIEMNLLDAHYKLHEQRKQMIKEIKTEIRATSSFTGINYLSAKVLSALEQVPRHLFVSPDDENYAYINAPLSIGGGQTISQPFIVALMTELLDIQPNDKVLEIGTGSGFQAAILAQLAKDVYTVEVISFLAKTAKEKLRKFGYCNIHILEGNGRKGWLAHAPYNKIIVTAAAESIPLKLLEQLSPKGRMVIPLGESKNEQFLTLVYKDEEGNIVQRTILSVSFVPFV